MPTDSAAPTNAGSTLQSPPSILPFGTPRTEKQAFESLSDRLDDIETLCGSLPEQRGRDEFHSASHAVGLLINDVKLLLTRRNPSSPTPLPDIILTPAELDKDTDKASTNTIQGLTLKLVKDTDSQLDSGAVWFDGESILPQAIKVKQYHEWRRDKESARTLAEDQFADIKRLEETYDMVPHSSPQDASKDRKDVISDLCDSLKSLHSSSYAQAKQASAQNTDASTPSSSTKGTIAPANHEAITHNTTDPCHALIQSYKSTNGDWKELIRRLNPLTARAQSAADTLGVEY